MAASLARDRLRLDLTLSYTRRTQATESLQPLIVLDTCGVDTFAPNCALLPVGTGRSRILRFDTLDSDAQLDQWNALPEVWREPRWRRLSSKHLCRIEPPSCHQVLIHRLIERDRAGYGLISLHQLKPEFFEYPRRRRVEGVWLAQQLLVAS